ncbi:MAG TPA: metallophosphoesterase family protein [Cyclobacteriaceae bacterium]|nr:metallophosphoesterase family protein [Cyclobacteriaceae bacterium]
MKIGLLSDTHSYLDPKIFEHFAGCDEIWHAGDIGDQAVADALAQFKPVRAVYGNIDDKILQSRFPEDLWFECEGMKIWMTHIGGAPPNYNPRVRKIVKEKVPDVFICGHSHILRVIKDEKLNMLYINPGAAGNHGFHSVKTIIKMEIEAKIKKMEVIELGKRGV